MRRAGLLAVLALAAVLAAPGAGGAAPRGESVSIEDSLYAPGRFDVLAGDTVTWSNDSIKLHTVTSVTDVFDSGDLHPHSRFVRAFGTPGAYAYMCTIHPFMHGEVDVHRLLLSAPPFVLHGGVIAFLGRAALPAGTLVTLAADQGTGFKPVASTRVSAGGTFAASVPASTSAAYRAQAGADLSPPTQVNVTGPRVLVRPSRLRGGGTRLAVDVQPSQKGATVVLQLHLRERFGWWPVGRRQLDARSRATFTVRRAGRLRARVVLTLRDGASRLATSSALLFGHAAKHR